MKQVQGPVFILAVISFLLAEAYLFSGSGDEPLSDDELTDLMKSLWNADVNRAGAHDITTNIQSKTDSDSSEDLAPERLFTHVNEGHLFNRSTYAAFLKLLNNYDPNQDHGENTTPEEESETTHFLNEISKTEVMQRTVHLLREKGKEIRYLVRKHSADEKSEKGYLSNWNELESQIREIWFTNFARHARSHVRCSSGFEHVFVGEYTDTEVEGFHNWIEFYLQEKVGNLNYLGYLYVNQPNIIGVHFTWHGRLKKYNAIIYGTSPEFDLAMYTVCYFVRHNKKCTFELAGHPVVVHTFDIDRDNSKHLGTAYVDAGNTN